MTDLLEQHQVLPKRFIVQLCVSARLRHIAYGDEQARIATVEVDQPLGADHQMAVMSPRTLEIQFINLDLDGAIPGQFQQRSQLRLVPLSCAKARKFAARSIGQVDSKRL